jgi:hypothetical protein
VEAFCWLALVPIVLRIVPFHWLTRFLAFEPGDGAVTDSAVRDKAFFLRAKRVRRALIIASRRAPWRVNCMAKAAAGACMLRARGMDSILTIGVRNTIRSGDLKAHAWLVAGGFIVSGGRKSHRNYSPITTFAYTPQAH